jgi:hypothetical protein
LLSHLDLSVSTLPTTANCLAIIKFFMAVLADMIATMQQREDIVETRGVNDICRNDAQEGPENVYISHEFV